MKTDNKDWYAIIMAGGSGERFWPISRRKRPKQLLKLLGKESFLQQAVRRVSAIVEPSNIFVITNIEQAREVRKQLPRLPKSNIIAEPCGKDTCAAVTLGAALVGCRSTSATMAVLPADHIIIDEKTFSDVLNDSFKIASSENFIVTIGIKPTEPHTGFGYIRVGDRLKLPDNMKNIKTVFHNAEQFVEKPNYETAVEYLNSGKYRWNAGMFIWSFSTILGGLKQYATEFYDVCQRWMRVAKNATILKKQIQNDYQNLKRISIDYALMEKAQNVVVADGDFGWDDLGSWSALIKHLPQDENGNCVVGEAIYVDAKGNLVFDARTKNKTLIANVGLNDSILVLTDDAVLIANKYQSQKVKELVKKLGENSKFKKLL
ncbi:MAG: mannose-1-phosphate guanylyltransferase [Verrucomicrobiia bacterium]